MVDPLKIFFQPLLPMISISNSLMRCPKRMGSWIMIRSKMVFSFKSISSVAGKTSSSVANRSWDLHQGCFEVQTWGGYFTGIICGSRLPFCQVCGKRCVNNRLKFSKHFYIVFVNDPRLSGGRLSSSKAFRPTDL